MSFLLRLLTVVELVIWIKKVKENRDANVARTEKQVVDPVHDCDRPARSPVLDDIQTQSSGCPPSNQST
jgi:hypothetical protein